MLQTARTAIATFPTNKLCINEFVILTDQLLLSCTYIPI